MAHQERTRSHLDLKDELRYNNSSPLDRYSLSRINSENREVSSGSQAHTTLKDQLRDRASPQRGIARKNSNSPQRRLRKNSDSPPGQRGSNSPLQRGVRRSGSGDKHSALKEELKTNPTRSSTRVGSGSPNSPARPISLKKRPSLSRARSSFKENPNTKSHGFMVRVNSGSTAPGIPIRASFREKGNSGGGGDGDAVAAAEKDINDREKTIPKQQEDHMLGVVSSLAHGLSLLASHNVDLVSDALMLCESLIRCFSKRGLRRRSSTTERTTTLKAIRRSSLTAKPIPEICEVVTPLVLRLLHELRSFPEVLLQGCYPVPALPESEERAVIVFPKQSVGRSHNIHAKPESYVPKPKKGTLEFSRQEAAIEASTALHHYGIPEHRNGPIYVLNDMRVALKTVTLVFLKLNKMKNDEHSEK
jgi:hypothetical protein